MKSIAAHAGSLQHVLCTHPDFQSLHGQKQAHARTSMTFRLEVIRRRECRKIERVVEIKVLFDTYPAPQHRTVVTACADRKNQRIGLGIAYPVGIEALVEDVEGGEESSSGYGQVTIPDVINFGIVQ